MEKEQSRFHPPPPLFALTPKPPLPSKFLNCNRKASPSPSFSLGPLGKELNELVYTGWCGQHAQTWTSISFPLLLDFGMCVSYATDVTRGWVILRMEWVYLYWTNQCMLCDFIWLIKLKWGGLPLPVGTELRKGEDVNLCLVHIFHHINLNQTAEWS